MQRLQQRQLRVLRLSPRRCVYGGGHEAAALGEDAGDADLPQERALAGAVGAEHQLHGGERRRSTSFGTKRRRCAAISRSSSGSTRGARPRPLRQHCFSASIYALGEMVARTFPSLNLGRAYG